MSQMLPEPGAGSAYPSRANGHMQRKLEYSMFKGSARGMYRVCGIFFFQLYIMKFSNKKKSSKISVINNISCTVLIFYHLHLIFLYIHIFSEPFERKLQRGQCQSYLLQHTSPK